MIYGRQANDVVHIFLAFKQCLVTTGIIFNASNPLSGIAMTLLVVPPLSPALAYLHAS